MYINLSGRDKTELVVMADRKYIHLGRDKTELVVLAGI